MSIRSARLAAGLTQRELADAVGVGRTTVTMWETCAVSPRAHTLRPLARVLGCAVDDLLPDDIGDSRTA